jgi:hypothetical protein
VDRLPVRPPSRRQVRQCGGIHFQGGDTHIWEAGTNISRIAGAKAVTDSLDRDLPSPVASGQPAPTPEGAAMATDASDRDQQQRRELEEIRRKFTETGARVGSLFEPAVADDQDDDVRPVRPALPAPKQVAPRPRPSRLAVAGVALALLVGTGLGYLLPRAGAKDSAPSPPAASAPASPVRTVTSVPEACLEATRKGDLTIHLYTIKVRDRRLAEALKAYTLASQACRKEASP